MAFKVVSLFCGPGGIDLGLKMAGFDIIWGVDRDKSSCETHKKWSNAEIINDDINNIDIDDIPNSDIIVSSLIPPFFLSRITGEVKDINLNGTTLDIISKKMPKGCIYEGPAGLILSNKQEILKEFLNNFEKIGYRIYYQILNYKDYGIPQNKRKLVIIGIRKDINHIYEFPSIQNKNITIQEAFKGLDNKELNLDDRLSISLKDKERKKVTILDKNMISPSIALGRLPINSDIPMKEDKLFTISYQEAAIIQSFPIEFNFSGNKAIKFRQIINAFAPKLAFEIANQLKNVLDKENSLNKDILPMESYRIPKNTDTYEIRNNIKCHEEVIKLEKLMLPDRYEGLEDNREKYDITKIILPVKEGIDKILELYEEIESSNRGAFLILKGKSGCGKTTFLRTLDVFIENIEIKTIFNDIDLVESINSMQDTKKG